MKRTSAVSSSVISTVCASDPGPGTGVSGVSSMVPTQKRRRVSPMSMSASFSSGVGPSMRRPLTTVALVV